MPFASIPIIIEDADLSGPNFATRPHVHILGALATTDYTTDVPTAYLDGSVSTDWILTGGDGGSATFANLVATITSGTVAGSFGRQTSVRPIRRIPGTTNEVVIALALDNITTIGNVRRWGFFDDINGYFYELKDGALGAVRRINGIDTRQEANQFSEFVTSPIVLNTAVHNYGFRYAAPCVFYQDSKFKHAIQPSTLLSPNMQFPIRLESINTTATTACAIVSGFSASVRWGPKNAPAKYTRLTTAGNYTLSGRRGILQRVVLGNPSTGAATSLRLYDSPTPSGTILSEIQLNKTNPFSLDYETPFYFGLSATWTGPDGDATVIYE